MKSLIVVVGPTAVGKTEVSIRLAKAIGGEIVSADSRQVYRHMDIGTAKPGAEQRARVAHHLIDVVDPDKAFSLAQYQSAASAAIDDIFARGKQPLLVGGSGLYVRAVTEGLRIPEVPPQPELRAELEARAAREGGLALYAELQQVDPAAAARIDPRNVRRTIRALEVHRVSGGRFSDLGRSQPPPYRVVTVGLSRPRPDLYARIDARVDAMIAAGLVEETRWLAQRYDWSLPSMSGLGYRQIGGFIRGECRLEEAIAAIKRDTRRFVRHQANWFRPSDPRIRWFEVTLGIDAVLSTVLEETSPAGA
ncbi:MAG: tRNA (adenosine(37)-N6)-dimethylallyltransferase MiaA [Anaerolineae bacterium]